MIIEDVMAMRNDGMRGHSEMKHSWAFQQRAESET